VVLLGEQRRQSRHRRRRANHHQLAANEILGSAGDAGLQHRGQPGLELAALGGVAGNQRLVDRAERAQVRAPVNSLQCCESLV
jgi:hypothetical protein